MPIGFAGVKHLTDSIGLNWREFISGRPGAILQTGNVRGLISAMARFSGIDDGGPCRCEAEPWVLKVDSASGLKPRAEAGYPFGTRASAGWGSGVRFINAKHEYPTCPLERDHAISGLDGRSSREPDRIFGNNPGL